MGWKVYLGFVGCDMPLVAIRFRWIWVGSKKVVSLSLFAQVAIRFRWIWVGSLTSFL